MIAVGGPQRSERLPPWYRDLTGTVAAGIYLAISLYCSHQVLAHLGSVCDCGNSDPTQWMWSWKWFPFAVTHGLDPVTSRAIWPPGGVDLASVTLAPATALPGVPLDALFGPLVAYNVMALAAPVLNAWAAYRLCRYVSGASWISVLAGYTYGFSAYEWGHLRGHLNLVFVFVPPMLALLALRFLNGEVRSRRHLLTGATILLLVQFGLSTEILLDLAILGAVTASVAYVVAPEYRMRLRDLAVTCLIACLCVGVVTSYYLYNEFRGPQPITNGGAIQTDLLSVVIPTDTFRLGANAAAKIAGTFNTSNPFEQNGYLGLPLSAIVGAFFLRARRRRLTKIVGIPMIVALVLSLGSHLTVGGHSTVALPFDLIAHVPIIGLSTPTRYGAFVSLDAAIVLAVWTASGRGSGHTSWRWLMVAAAVVFLIPNLGMPLRLGSPDQPRFFTSDLYQRFLSRDEVVLTVPFGQNGDGMLWQADTDMYFRLFDGYFGPPPPANRADPLVEQLFDDQPSPPFRQELTELRHTLTRAEVGAIVIQQGSVGTWPALLERLGWQEQIAQGGVEVFTEHHSPPSQDAIPAAT